MEIIEGDRRSPDGFVQIAYVDTDQEAALVRGLLRGEGDIPSLSRAASAVGGRGVNTVARSPRRIYVRPDDADDARALLGEILIEEPVEEAIPESVNAEYLARAAGPHDRSAFHAFARATAVVLAVLATGFVVFLLLR